MNRLFSSLIDLFFPPFCSSCHQPLPPNLHLLCKECLSELQSIGQEGRCPKCFHELEEKTHRCPQHLSPLTKLSFCFEESPALFSLCPESLSHLMVLHWLKLQWPIPDLVIPTPTDWFSHKSWSKKVAKSFAASINRPYCNALRLKRHCMPIPYLSLEQQPSSVPCIEVRAAPKLVNKTVLLIHDNYETGNAVAMSALALKEGGALEVRALSAIIK